jgi:mycothiol synthase
VVISVQMRHPVAPGDVASVRVLVDAAALADGHPPFGDAVLRDLRSPSKHTVVFLAFDGEQPIGALHAIQADDRSVTAAVVVHPQHRQAGVAAALVDAWLAVLARYGARHVSLWAFGADARADAFAASAGFELERELWQMRVALPLGEEPRWPDGIAIRPFVPGADERDWVAVNNRSFVHDPDQGGWTEAHLRQLESEPWFDPAGFLLACDDRGIAGFCWTKVHPPAPPHELVALGEIYVIGVDPDRQGMGFGRALVVAGLASLHARGTSVGMLFVDASNTAATELYQRLGFETTRVDRAYGRELT